MRVIPAIVLGRPALVAIAAAIVATAGATGCARSHPVTDTGLAKDIDESTSGPIVLEVENHNWSDINIYVIHDGRRDRLTSVTAAKDLSMELPPQYQGEMGIFRLIIYRIGGKDSYTTDPISTRTGNTVRLTVESDLQRTSVGVW